jgi:Organic solute transport protein 1
LFDCSGLKLFNMATMAVKLQVLRCNRLMDMSLVTEGKLRELRDMTASPALRDELTRIKGGLSVFYGSLSAGELARVRTNLLNNYRKYNHPVGVLISFGFQSENGHFIIPTDGPNMQNLGAATVYCEDGSIMDEYVLPIAGKSVEAVPQYVGDNLFSATWVLRRQRGAANNNMDAGCSRSEPSGYTGDSGSGTEYDNDLAACCVADDSDTDSVCSTASYAERLQATRAAAAGLGSPSAAGVHGGGRGRSSDPIQDF